MRSLYGIKLSPAAASFWRDACLRGLGTGLLAARLKHLEREGLAREVTLPAPARSPAYALTEAGGELGPAVLELARWGMKWALGELIEDGSATASGDPRVLSRLGGPFRLPRPRSRTPESPAT